VNKKMHANSRRGRRKHPHAPERPAGTLAEETAGPAEDVKKMVLMIEELRVAEEELRVQNEELATARQAIEAERARYHELFEFAPDGYVVTDAAGIIREANRIASAMLNAPQHRLLGKPFALYVAGVDRDAFRIHLSQVQSKKAIKEWEFRLKPRERPPLSVALKVSIAEPSSESGLHIRWLLRDITQRKQAEEALQKVWENYHNIFEHAVEGIFQKSPEGRYLSANPSLAHIYGYESPEDLMGSVTDIARELYVDPRRREELKRLIEEQGVLEGFEAQMRRKDGGKVWVSEHVRAVRDRSGKVVYYEGTTQDITERKRAEGQLQDSLTLSRALSRRLESVREEERARIARDLHDEVGQALTALKLNLQVVQRKSPDELSSPLESSVGTIDRLLERVRGISLDLRPSLLDDLGLITTLKWWTEHQVPQTGARIELMADTIEPRLPLDLETACFRIVEEAVNNATKYAKARRINVILRKQDGRLDLVIRDDGRGFDLNAVLARAARGESMGLLGMEERVKHLGGLFTITSQPGQGTEIRATFPLGTSAGTGEKAETSASP
jgi:PAS domain S-box-containing protein